jgi:MFS family permease
MCFLVEAFVGKKLRAVAGRTRWIRGLFVVNGLIWLCFSLRGLILTDTAYGLPPESSWIISVMMAGNGVALLVFGWLVKLRERRFNNFAVAYVGLNAVLSITDEAGLFDYLVLSLNLMLLVLLLIEGRRLPAKKIE